MPLSIVIPALNEAGNIGRLAEEILDTLTEDLIGEIIVVNDGSSDDTAEEVRAVARKSKKVRLLHHRHTSGQSACLRTGVLAARHKLIATMDGDGQNDPRDLAAMARKIGDPDAGTGPALVGGVRVQRRDSGSKRLASKAANWIRDKVLQDNCPDTGCGIKVFWRESFLRLPYFTSMHRYLPALFQMYGLKTEYIPVNDRPRIAGQSKYNNLNRALIGLYDLFGVTWLRKRTIVPKISED